MALPRGIDLLPDEVRVLLLPGERPLAYELATQLAGHTGVGGDPRPRPGLHFDPDPLAGGIGADQGWVDSRIGGVNSAGAVGSRAMALLGLLKTGAVTRLLHTLPTA